MSVSISTHVLDTAAGNAGRRGSRRARPQRRAVVASGETDADGRIAELADGSRARPLRAHLPAAVAVLHAGRARGRARRRPPPRPAPRLALRMRELPRKLTRRRARASSSRAARGSSSGSPRSTTRSSEADEVLATLSDEDKVEALARASRDRPARRASRPARPPSRVTTTDPAVLAELARLNAGVRGEVRLPLRRLRQPAARSPRSSTCSAHASAGRERRSSTPAAASSSRSRGIDGPVPERRPRRPASGCST